MVESKKPDNDIFAVLIVDDEPEICEVLASFVEPHGYRVFIASSANDALEILAQEHHRTVAVISDYQMPGMNGFAFRKETLSKFNDIPFILVSGYLSREEVLKAIELQLTAFLDKPIAAEIFREAFERAVGPRIQSLREERELLDGFIADATNLVDELEPLILGLEGEPQNIDSLDRIFAILHTIKGTSGFFKPPTIHRFSHRFEDFLTPFKRQEQQISPVVISAFLGGLDTLKRLILSLKTGARVEESIDELLKIFDVKAGDAVVVSEKERGPAVAATGAVASDRKGPEEVKVAIRVLDEFMELSGEITVLRNMITKLVRKIEREVSGNRNIQFLSELLDEMHKINGAMQEKVVDLRKVALKGTTRILSRTVRDLALQLKKEVDFTISGEDIRIDTVLAEVLSNSLIHMVRNSMDHGIELPVDREKNGKSRKGILSLSAKEQNDEIQVILKDDGRGINPEVIRKKLIEKKLFSPEQVQKMSDREIQAQIFAPGFSTADTVTDISGRGVGMDMVLKSLHKIGGGVDIDSTVGKGTTFTLHLPLPKSVMIIGSVVVQAKENTFAIPQDAVVRFVRIAPEERSTLIQSINGANFLRLAGRVYPIIGLDEFTKDIESANARKIASIREDDVIDLVLVQAQAKEFALHIDTVLDMEDTVVKKVGRHISKYPVYIGATFLGDGQVSLILNVEQIAELCGIKLEPNVATAISGSDKSIDVNAEVQRQIVTFSLGDDSSYGIDLNDVFRLETLPIESIQYSGKSRVVQYRDRIMPLRCLRKALRLDGHECFDAADTVNVIVLRQKHKNEEYLGLVVREITDLINTTAAVDETVRDRPEIAGALITTNKTVTMIASKEIWNAQWGASFESLEPEREAA